MTFQISQSRRDELLRIEEETNCDIGAGVDHGPHLGQYLAARMNYIDRSKLVSFLKTELDNLLRPEEIEALADTVEAQVRHRIERETA